jgi:GST-like protein
MACIGWIKPHKRQGQNLDDYPNLKRWYETVMARPGRQGRHGGWC